MVSSPALPAFPVCQRSSWNKQGEIEKSCQLLPVTANKVAFPSPHSSERRVRTPSRCLCLYSRAAWHPGVLIPQMFRPRTHRGSCLSLVGISFQRREDARSWLVLRTWPVCLPCLQDSSEVALPAGTPLSPGAPLAKQFLLSPFSYWCQGCLFKEQMNLPQECPVSGLRVL